jgi:carbonic anhydrase/acetyltransferase-like protein (isoleucine patch superfamily)
VGRALAVHGTIECLCSSHLMRKAALGQLASATPFLIAGNPAVFLRKLKPEEAKFLPESAEHYAQLSAEHLAESYKPLEQIAADRGLLA